MTPGRRIDPLRTGPRHSSPQSVDQGVKTICDIMRRGNCAGAVQYVPELTWILFLRILDEKEQREEQETAALGVPFRPSLEAPFRWRDWAAPPEALSEGQANRRVELQNSPQNAFFNFVNLELLPHLKRLKDRPDATPRQKVISEIMTGVERVRIDTERNFLDVPDKVHQLNTEALAAKAGEIEDAVYDLKAVNPHKKPVIDTRTPEELLAIIEAKGHEIADALATLRALSTSAASQSEERRSGTEADVASDQDRKTQRQ